LIPGFVYLVVGVDPHEAGQNEKVSVIGEDVLELLSRVDDDGHRVAQDARVLGVQRQGPVDDVDEELGANVFFFFEKYALL
jgi:hypothetical protein